MAQRAARNQASFSRTVTAAPEVVGDRLVAYVFSDESVGRDNHVVSTAGWELGNFRSNPVFLWAHDTLEPPVGRVVDISKLGAQLRGVVEYATAEQYPFADTVFRLVKGRFLNAVSTSWRGLDWKYTTDKSRPGGIDFLRQELFEVSQVPLPALPTALATARAAGIDTRPVYEWAERVLDRGGLSTVPRPRIEEIRLAAKMPQGVKLSSAELQARAARRVEAERLKARHEAEMARAGLRGPFAQAIATMPVITVAQRRALARRLQQLHQANI